MSGTHSQSATVPAPAGPAAPQDGVFSPLFRRLLLWVIFGLIFSPSPLAVVAMRKWFPSTGLPGFLKLVSNADLLAVAFVMALAAAGDVLTSGEKLKQLKWFCGLLTLGFAFFAAMLYVLLELNMTHLSEHQVIRSIQQIYIVSMAGSLTCELFAEIR